MRRSPNGFIKGLAAGLVIGLVVGSAALAVAAFGKKGWEAFGPMFQQGYMAGFIDAVRISKQTEPGGFMARNYVIPPKTMPMHWARAVSRFYSDPKNADRPMSQAIIVVGKRLEARFGPEVKAPPAALEQLRQLLQGRRRKKSVKPAPEDEGKEGKTVAVGNQAGQIEKPAVGNQAGQIEKPAAGDQKSKAAGGEEERNPLGSSAVRSQGEGSGK